MNAVFIYKYFLPIMIWFIPLIFVLKIGKNDNRFFFRKIIFPYWYLLQRLFEKFTRVRIACRVLHIMALIVTFYGVVFLLYIVTGFSTNTFSDSHFIGAFIYILIGTFVYLFQPKKNKTYETK